LIGYSIFTWSELGLCVKPIIGQLELNEMDTYPCLIELSACEAAPANSHVCVSQG